MVFIDPRFAKVVQKISPGGRLLRAWGLKGGISAEMTGLEIETPGWATRKLILRRPGETTLRRNPRAAEEEYRILQLAHRLGLAVPEVYDLDTSGMIFPGAYCIMEYIEGRTLKSHIAGLKSGEGTNAVHVEMDNQDVVQWWDAVNNDGYPKQVIVGRSFYRYFEGRCGDEFGIDAPDYAVSKAGMVNLARCLARLHGITESSFPGPAAARAAASPLRGRRSGRRAGRGRARAVARAAPAGRQ